MLLNEYLALFRKALEKIEQYGFSDSIEIREEIRANKQAVLNARVVLIDNSVLYIKEYIDARYGIERMSYGYQYLDREGNLIFRYDNAKHRPDLGYEAHKHLADGSISAAALPDIFDLVDEILGYLK
jgi:hypothetical protein